MKRRWIVLQVIAATLAVSAYSCGGAVVPLTCTDFHASTDKISLNNAVGSDPTAANTPTPIFTVATDGGLASYAMTVDGKSIGTIKNQSSATACAQATALLDGTHTIGGRELAPHAVNLAPLTFKVDTVAPPAPSKPVFKSKSGTTVTLTGTAQASVAIQIYEGTLVRGGTRADSSGNWTAAAILTTGTHTLYAIAIDTAGNHSPPSPVLTVTV